MGFRIIYNKKVMVRNSKSGASRRKIKFGKRLQQKAPYTLSKSGVKRFLTDLEPPMSNKSECDFVGSGTFKKAYVCNKIKSAVRVKNVRNNEITVTNDFVLYRPSDYILQEAAINPWEARKSYQESIANIMNVTTYNDSLKSFFLNPIDTIKY